MNIDNLFEEFVDSGDSETIDDGIQNIKFLEKEHERHAKAFNDDVRDIRLRLRKMELAMTHLVNWYGPLLPTGWVVVTKFDAWINGMACAGFRHIDGKQRHLIGGDAITVNDLGYQLDKLYNFLFAS